MSASLCRAVCATEVPAANFHLHIEFCRRNNTKCPYCNLGIRSDAFEAHLAELSSQETFHGAIQAGDVAAVQNILLHKADIDAVSSAGDTALHLAVRQRHVEVVAALLAAKASVEIPNAMHDTVAQAATKLRPPHGEIAQLIREHHLSAMQSLRLHEKPVRPPSANLPPPRGERRGSRPVVGVGPPRPPSTTSESGVIRGKRPSRLRNIVDMASIAGSDSSESRSRSSSVDRDGTSTEAVLTTDPSSSCSSRSSAGNAAAVCPTVNTTAPPVGFSCCHNCGKHVPSNNLPLHVVHCERTTWRCPMCDEVMAVGERAGHEERFNDEDAMYAAAASGELHILEAHVKHGASIRSINSNGDTLLHIAVRRSTHQVVEWLMQQNADTTLQNCMHDTPMQIAQRSGDQAILDMLRA